LKSKRKSAKIEYIARPYRKADPESSFLKLIHSGERGGDPAKPLQVGFNLFQSGGYMKTKLSIALLTAMILISCASLGPILAPEPAGQGIGFSLNGGTFTNLQIEGTDPQGAWKTWQRNSTSGLSLATTEDQKWQGTVVLIFEIAGLGKRSCVIDHINEPPGSTMAIITYTEGGGCSSESGSVRELGARQALFEYLEARDGLKILELSDAAADATECAQGIAEALAGGVTSKVIGACGGTTMPAINEILAKYSLHVETAGTPETEAPIAQEPSTPPAPALAPTPTTASTDTPLPVSSLRGTVTQTSNCRYGPGAAYLYKYGVRPGTPMEAIGRDADGSWLKVQGVGGNNPCWINAQLIQVEGDRIALPDAYPLTTGLPISPYFERISVTSVWEDGQGVNVEWAPHEIPEELGIKEEGVVEYIVEVWTCVDGQPDFTAFGTDETTYALQIDNSCGVASHATVIGQDKEGFSPPATINLP
jgi:hypothetical protein